MRSVFLIGLSVLLVVVAGGYSITWFFQAARLKSSLEQSMVSLGGKQSAISYDSIESSGFPGSIVVSIVNPRFKGRIDEFYNDKPMPIGTPKPDNAPSHMQPWEMEIALQGSISFSINALSDHYAAVMRGVWRNKNVINGKTLEMTNSPQSDTVCFLDLLAGSSVFNQLWDMRALTDTTQLADNFRKLDCSIGASKTIDSASKETLMSNGPFRFYLTNNLAADQRTARFYLKVADSEVTEKGDAFINMFMAALAPSNFSSKQFSIYGKQNIEIDTSYSGPARMEALMANPANINFNVSKFDISNSAYNSTTTLAISNQSVDDSHAIKLSFKSNTEFTKIHDVMMRDLVKNFISQVYSKDSSDLHKLNDAKSRYSEAEFLDIVSPAIPNFHSLGKMVLSLDAAVNGNTDIKQGSFTLNDFEISAAPYGIKAKGEGKIEQSPVPSGSLSLNCNNCLRLIDDIASYAARVENVISVIDPPSAKSFAIDPKLVEGYKQFLTALGIAETNTPANMTFSVVSDPKTGISINGKDTIAAMQLYGQYVVPYLPKPQMPQPGPVQKN